MRATPARAYKIHFRVNHFGNYISGKINNYKKKQQQLRRKKHKNKIRNDNLSFERAADRPGHRLKQERSTSPPLTY